MGLRYPKLSSGGRTKFDFATRDADALAMVRRGIALLFTSLSLILPLAAQGYPGPTIGTTQAKPEPATNGWPGLRRSDAQMAMNLIREAGFLTEVLPDGAQRTIVARDVRARFVGRSRLPPPTVDGFQSTRWDLVINGYDIDPRRFFVLHNDQQINLAALFSYGEEFKPNSQAPIWNDTRK